MNYRIAFKFKLIIGINLFLSLFLLCPTNTQFALGAEISTNETLFVNPPSWLTESRVNRTVESVQRYMEWNIRRVTVKWYTNQDEFQKAHGYDSSVLAVSNKAANLILI